MLEPLVEEIWTAARPLRFFGAEIGTRMTVVRLPGGGLFVHSPVALDPAMREAVSALGPVTAIVAPNLYHHLFVGDWARAYPGASVWACPGLPEKRKDVAFHGVLSDAPQEAFAGALDQVVFGALPMLNEVVFFHRKTKTLISSDLVFDLANHPSGLTRALAFLLGNTRPGPTMLERFLIKDRDAAAAQIGTMSAWEAERIVLAHGPVISSGGASVLRDGYQFLSPR